jgi:hypothetical protein
VVEIHGTAERAFDAKFGRILALFVQAVFEQRNQMLAVFIRTLHTVKTRVVMMAN